MENKDKNAHNSWIVMVSTLASRLLGILKARVIGAAFGATGIADVINFTFNIPNNFRKLFAEGALTSALIPTFSRLLGLGEKQRSKRLFALLCTYQTLLLLPLVISSYLYGDQLVGFLSDFDASQISLGAKLLPFFMIYLATISLAAVFNGVLQAHQTFLVAYISPLLFSTSVIFGVIFFSESLGPMVMAYSSLVGGILQAIVSYISVRRYGYRFQVAVKTDDPAFKSIVKAWTFVLAGSGMQIISQMVTLWFASALGEGSVTALTNSTIFYQTPYGIFFNAIMAVSFPIMSTAIAKQDSNALRCEASKSFLYVSSLLIPSTILLYTLSSECVSAVLQTGNYTLSDAQLTAYILKPYLLFMTVIAWYGVMQRVGYSAFKHGQMTVVALIQTVLDILLMWVFIKLGMDSISLPLANGISFAATLLLLLWLLKDIYPVMHDHELFRQLGRMLLANIPLLLACIGYKQLDATWYQSGSNLRNFIFAALLAIAGMILVYISYSIAKLPVLALIPSKKHGSNLKGNG